MRQGYLRGITSHIGMSMKKTSISLVVALLSLGCGGRGSLPKTFPTTVTHWSGGTLDRVEFLQDFNIADYRAVRVESVDYGRATLPTSDENTYKPVMAVLDRATSTFADGLRSNISRPPVETSASGAGKALVVRASVTEMDPGSASLRFWVNFGAGKAHTTMSGEVSDSSTGRTLLRFERTEVDTGMTNLGLAGYESLLNGEIRETGKRVGTLLASFTPTSR
jgi:hypothetical protein